MLICSGLRRSGEVREECLAFRRYCVQFAPNLPTVKDEYKPTLREHFNIILINVGFYLDCGTDDSEVTVESIVRLRCSIKVKLGAVQGLD